jgi:predicted GNAT superfamily acetyltransferase
MADTQVFSIRELRSYDEFLQVHRVQQTIWGFGEPGTGLYPPFLYTASKNGGVVLGAFDPEDHMIGYIFSFLGREPGGSLKLCSQTMGVLAGWRGQGVATALKWAQRERTLAAGLSLITWTFDPLESGSARLNMHKLGAVSRRYWRNIYGEHFGALNEGLPSDRLLVEWWVRGRRVGAKVKAEAEVKVEREEGASVFEVKGRGKSRQVMGFRSDLDVPCLALEVPADIQGLKQVDISLALDWRLQVREAFETYFERNYAVTDFRTQGTGETRCNYYILSQMTEGLRDWIGLE